jgi:hypothetical protein
MVAKGGGFTLCNSAPLPFMAPPHENTTGGKIAFQPTFLPHQYSQAKLAN